MGAPDLIPLFGLGVMQKSRPATAQQRVNLYYEVQQDKDRTAMVAYGTPGLELFVNFGDTPVRGWIAPPVSSFSFFVHRGTFWQVDNAGVMTNRGTINTTEGKVSIAENGRYVVVVDGTNGYYYDMNAPATPIAQIAAPTFPNGANTVTWLKGFFICELLGSFYISGANDPTTWPGDFASAESNPDNIVRVLADHQDLHLLGDKSIEFWAVTGDPAFPFTPIPGGAVEWGLAARNSVAKFDDSLCLLAQNQLGQVIAARLAGYRIMRISNHDLEAKWAEYAGFSDAVGYSYMLDGHPMYVVSFPTGGETWMFDGSTNSWTQLKSFGLTRHRGELGGQFLGKPYLTDYASGKVYRLKPDVYTDNGDTITRTIVGRHLFNGFTRMGVDAFQLDIETGVGLATGQGSNPQAMLRVSRDGGRRWGPQRFKSFGKVGEYTKRCIWRQCGRGRDFTFEVSISDPVKVAILGAGIKPRGGTS